MPNRLPLELELTIFELAAPPLSVDHLHDRVDFFINASLVHRSLTAWAQERLHDQFLYTYHRRADEHERLKKRFEAGFGRDGQVRRLYLDLTGLPKDVAERTNPGADSVSVTVDGRVYEALSLARGPSNLAEAGTSVQEQACDAVAHFEQPGNNSDAGTWEMCAMITGYSQALDTLWLKLPFKDLNIKNLPPPRVLLVDDVAFRAPWDYFGSLPVSSRTVLFLRNINLGIGENGGNLDLDTRHLILANCKSGAASVSDILNRLHHLETLVLFETEVDDLYWMLDALPTTIRSVHILECTFDGDDHPGAPIVLPHLESSVFTSFGPSTSSGVQKPANDYAYSLHSLQQLIESFVVAPHGSLKYLRSTKSPEEALAAALAELGFESS